MIHQNSSDIEMSRLNCKSSGRRNLEKGIQRVVGTKKKIVNQDLNRIVFEEYNLQCALRH